jgi:type IV secretory pathway VirB4 component
VLYGHNTDSAGIVWWDRWSQHNHNSVILARSGAGKSYLIKLEILRSLYDLIAVAVIDPEDEYPRLAKAIGGTIARLGAPGVRLNPFDIPAADRQRDALVRRQLFLHTLISVLLAEPVSPAVLDKAVNATYAAAGINNDPATWNRPAPLLRNLAATLAASTDPAAQILADRLSPWTHGSFKDLFDGPSTVTPTGQLVVWSTRLLPDELRPAGMLLALDAIWRDVDAPTTTNVHEGRPPQVQRRLVVVDEAWTLLRDGEGAKFLNRLAKAARKRHAGLSVVTQDAADVLGSDLGRAVVSNAATQILMRQAPQAIEAITNAFALTAGEARVLLAAQKGQGLLLGGSLRCGFQVVASPREHLLCATGIADMGEPDGDGEDASWAA